jgi:hypothetical protein
MNRVFVVSIVLALSFITTLIVAQDETPEVTGTPLISQTEALDEPTPPDLTDDHHLQDVSLITSDPCAAPCWRGITPGETEWEDALIILEDDPALTDPALQRDEESGAVVAEFQQIDSSIQCCQIFSESGDLVDIIFLRLAPTRSVGEVIEAQGEPTYLVGSPFSEGQAIMNLVFIDVPMVVYAFIEGMTGELTEESEIIGVLYLTETDMELLLQTTNLHEWEGYGMYEEYEQGAYEVTPSVTLTPVPSNG